MSVVTAPPSLGNLRRRLAGIPGLIGATASAPDSRGRAEDARIVPAELIEPAPLRARPVGRPEPWPGTLAFLDGVQHLEVIAYAGAAPLCFAQVAAAVRERVDREARTVLTERRRLAIARPAVLALAGSVLDGLECLALPEDEETHPLRDLELARALVDTVRGELERRVGDSYRRSAPHWLIVDGSLAESYAWASDPRMLGLSKSHATLPFAGKDLPVYLQLPAGHRSNVFRPASRRVPVYAWGLRLWEREGKDLLHGLVRVEVAPIAEQLELADQLSRWLLAERTPLASDPRRDRLIYGIHSVAEYLNATDGTS